MPSRHLNPRTLYSRVDKDATNLTNVVAVDQLGIRASHYTLFFFFFFFFLFKIYLSDVVQYLWLDGRRQRAVNSKKAVEYLTCIYILRRSQKSA